MVSSNFGYLRFTSWATIRAVLHAPESFEENATYTQRTLFLRYFVKVSQKKTCRNLAGGWELASPECLVNGRRLNGAPVNILLAVNIDNKGDDINIVIGCCLAPGDHTHCL